MSAIALSASGAVHSASALGEVPAGPGVCEGVAGCKVKARVDVNGDGLKDVVGVARRGENGAPEGGVLVRVKTGAGQIASTRAGNEYWYGPVWQGTAALDGRKGKEIVVGFTVGAHGQSYRALTWRRGRLVTLDAPGRGRYWYVDSAMWIAAGWQRRGDDPVGTVTRRVAMREGNDADSPFRGRATTFTWARGGWKNVGTETIYPMSDEDAYTWGGFRIPGLPRW